MELQTSSRQQKSSQLQQLSFAHPKAAPGMTHLHFIRLRLHP